MKKVQEFSLSISIKTEDFPYLRKFYKIDANSVILKLVHIRVNNQLRYEDDFFQRFFSKTEHKKNKGVGEGTHKKTQNYGHLFIELPPFLFV